MFDHQNPRPEEERYFFTLSDEIRLYITKISDAIAEHQRTRQIDNLDLRMLQIYQNP